jgi:hypothetical protein
MCYSVNGSSPVCLPIPPGATEVTIPFEYIDPSNIPPIEITIGPFPTLEIPDPPFISEIDFVPPPSPEDDPFIITIPEVDLPAPDPQPEPDPESGGTPGIDPNYQGCISKRCEIPYIYRASSTSVELTDANNNILTTADGNILTT